MRHVLLFIIVSIFYSFPGNAQLEKTLLWQVTGNNLKAPSYLYGTIHLMCPGDIKVTETIKEKFTSTQQLYLELKMDDPALMIEMMKGMRMKDSTTIKSLLKAPQFDSVSAIFSKSTGLPLNMFNNTKPILIVSMIYPYLLGCTPDSWEGTFQKMASQQKKPLYGLEKITEQMAVLESIPYLEQAKMLEKTVLNLDSSRNAFLNMLKIYKEKDISKLYKLTTDDDDYGPYEKDLLINRNRNWIPVMKNEMKKMPTFFAFGAAHMGGTDGIIELLRKEGYKVEPVLY